MRKIKFRGMARDDGRKVIGHFFTDMNLEGSYDFYIDVFPSPHFDEINPVEIEPDSLSQWTGCVDKRGAEIYEGDRVSFRGNRGKTLIGTVEFRHGAFIIVPISDDKHLPRAFILGDIDDARPEGARLSDVEILNGGNGDA